MWRCGYPWLCSIRVSSQPNSLFLDHLTCLELQYSFAAVCQQRPASESQSKAVLELQYIPSCTTFYVGEE